MEKRKCVIWGSESGTVSGSKDAGGGATANMVKDLGSGNTVANAAPSSSPSSNISAGTGKSGLGSGLLKGLGKRALGPLGYIADATAIATAKPGKERNQAIGSTVGGGIGSTIGGIVGSVIPVAGTMIGSTLGGTVGSFIGEKVGGGISGIGDKFKEGKEKVSKWFSNTFSFGKKTRKPFNRKRLLLVSPPSGSHHSETSAG